MRKEALLNRTVLVFAILSAFAFFTAAGEKCDYIEGTLIEQGAALRTPTRPLTLCMKEYVTPEEMAKFAEIFRQGGQKALENAISKLEKGTVMIGSGLGSPVGIIAKKTTEDGSTLYRILLDRRIAFGELWHGTRSLDYPFGLIEIKLGPDGKGQGIMLPAAKIEVGPNGITFENLDNLPWKLMNLRYKGR